MPPVEIDLRETWPPDVREYVESVEPTLARWWQRRRELQELSRRDLAVRFDPPPNEFAVDAVGAAATLDRMLEPHSFLVRHCTRLTAEDIGDINSNGIVPLSIERTAERLGALQEAAKISAEQTEALLRESQAGEESRRDRTYWIFGRAPLREEPNVRRLFRFWGGEALFIEHEDGPLGRVLASNGTAAIVEAVIPYGMLDPISTIGEELRNAIASREVVNFEGTTRDVVPPEMIQRIVLFGTDEFETLTNVSTWPGVETL